MSKLLSLFVVAVLTLGITVPAGALSPAQKRLYQSGVHQFDIEVSANNDSCEGSVHLSGNSNIARAFNFFTDEERGELRLSPDQSAGIVGNLIAESAVFPTRKQGQPTSYKATMADIREAIRLNKEDSTQGFGIGIAQWTSWTRLEALVEQAGSEGNPLTLNTQLPFLWSELPENGLPELRNATNVRQAAWIFMAYFERPGVVVDAGLVKNPNQPTSGAAKEELDERERLAQGVLDGDNSPTSDSSGCGAFGSALDGNESEPDFNKDYNVRYDGPPADNQCTGGFTPGAESLKEIILDAYSPPVSSIGGYACRDNTADPGSVSIHGVGRALDIMIDSTTPEGKETGDKIRNLLINNAENIGIQLVIWDRHTWSVNHQGWRPYTGPNPHIDHLHVEINIAASNNPQLGK